MMQHDPIHIHIRQWAAWAPGLTTHEHWQEWSKAPHITHGDDMPDVADLPAMQRRRMNRLSRMCYVVANAITGSAQLPQIYCSRHGDLIRSGQLLEQLAQHEPLSSTSFGLSVHNAAGASISILQKNTQPVTSIAVGKNGVQHAFYEVLAHLAEYPSVVLIVYDEIVPAIHQVYNTPVFAYALLIERGNTHQLDFQGQSEDRLTSELSLLLQIIQGRHVLKFQTDRNASC